MLGPLFAGEVPNSPVAGGEWTSMGELRYCLSIPGRSSSGMDSIVVSVNAGSCRCAGSERRAMSMAQCESEWYPKQSTEF
jgi:hypothetical protein